MGRSYQRAGWQVWCIGARCACWLLGWTSSSTRHGPGEITSACALLTSFLCGLVHSLCLARICSVRSCTSPRMSAYALASSYRVWLASTSSEPIIRLTCIEATSPWSHGCAVPRTPKVQAEMGDCVVRCADRRGMSRRTYNIYLCRA